MTTPTSQAIEKASNGPGALVAQYRDDFALVLPTHIDPKQWVRVAQGVMRRDPKLTRAAQNNPGSFLSAMLDCARLGLEPGDTYHLVPFGNEVTGIKDYKGEIELVYRAGAVASVKAEVVYEHDEFEWDGGQQMERPRHQPSGGWFADRGRMIGGYAYAVMTTGATSRVVVMSEAEILEHKKVSKSSGRSDSPWNRWPKAMWLKTLVHELQKWVPTSAEYRQELMRSQAAAGDVSPDLAGQLPAPNPPDDDGLVPVDEDGVVEAEIVNGDDDPERPFE